MVKITLDYNDFALVNGLENADKIIDEIIDRAEKEFSSFKYKKLSLARMQFKISDDEHDKFVEMIKEYNEELTLRVMRESITFG